MDGGGELAVIFRGEYIVVVVWTGLRQLSVASLSVGEVDAALQSTEPGLLQLLRVGLQSTTPGNKQVN